MSSFSVSPYSNSPMFKVTLREVAGFLPVRDALASYACTDRRHCILIDQFGLPFKSVSILSHLTNQFFANIHKFPQAHTLELTGSRLFQLAFSRGVGRIDRLIFKGLSKQSMRTEDALRLLHMIPNLKGLRLQKTELSLFQSSEGESLPEAVKQNLRSLTSLELVDMAIHNTELLDILQCSTNFRLLDLRITTPSEPNFKELVRSPNLHHLNLSLCNAREEVDYGILAKCHALENFTPGWGFDEGALSKIFEANPDLTDLDLSSCDNTAMTDRVLQMISANLAKLTHLKLNVSGRTFSDEGLLILIQECKQLKSLTILSYAKPSLDLLPSLRDCPQLKRIEIKFIQLIDEDSTSIFSIT